MWSISEQKRRIHRRFGAFAHFFKDFIFFAETVEIFQNFFKNSIRFYIKSLVFLAF